MRARSGARRGKGGTASLGSLIARVYPAGEPAEALELRVFGAFGRSVSERVLANAGPVRFRDGVLYVHTSTSAWSDALSLDAPEILQQMRARLGGVTVKRLAFRTGPFTPPVRAPEAPKLEQIDLSALPAPVAQELAHIADDHLRDAVAKAALSSLSKVSKRRRR